MYGSGLDIRVKIKIEIFHKVSYDWSNDISFNEGQGVLISSRGIG